MKLIVNPHKIEIDKNPVNEREIDVTKCEFEFAEEITSDYVKEAYFTFNGTTYKQIIVNNECSIPSEVLEEKGQVEIGVVAYLVENSEEIKRYNPSPAYFNTWVGSLKDKVENTEPITPSEMEQFEQALNNGLNEVSNVDIDSEQLSNGTSVTITNRNGESQTTYVYNGQDGKDGKDGVDGITPTIGDNGNWYLGDTDTGKPSRGETGATGPAGQDGQNGVDGFSPIANVSKSGNTATITITDKIGTTSTTVNDGTNGQDGVGVPTGGTTGQVLAKIDNTDYNTQWIAPPNPDLSNYYTKTETNNLVDSFEENRINYVLELTDNSNNKPALSRKNILSTDYSKIQDMIQYFIDNNINRGLVKIKIGTFPTIFGLASLYSTSVHILCLTETDISFPTGGEYNVCFTKFYSSFSKTNDTVTSINSAYWLACFNANNFGNYLAKNNNTAYTPTNDYNPSTKKYVDDSISSAVGNINTILATLTTPSNGGGN